MKKVFLIGVTVVMLCITLFFVPSVFAQDIFPSAHGFWGLHIEDKLFILHQKSFWLLEGVILIVYAIYLYHFFPQKEKEENYVKLGGRYVPPVDDGNV